MSKYLERAKEIRAIETPHHNCAQSVLMSFTQSLDLDDETAYKIAVAFGGGMKSGITCGAVVGALMTLGMFEVDDIETTQKIIREFKERHSGMIDCKDLLKANADAGGQKKPHCDALVYEMVQEVEKILIERKKI
ncbi:MAG: C-GCAxxG-C-C family protein [Treponema sp.]|uniref:C-GCAxxG-C-C family protein n=1 Tax=Treponema sp. TaxID=166 RepID=UPI00298D601D|nr:C-GCAxxG-C-C family protein [Treponema sp.]MCQ2601997.1 C-GCAxxG-C-C family protein [Treponema sp.]